MLAMAAKKILPSLHLLCAQKLFFVKRPRKVSLKQSYIPVCMIAAVTNPSLLPYLPASPSLPFSRQQARPVLKTNESGGQKAICTHVLSPSTLPPTPNSVAKEYVLFDYLSLNSQLLR